MSGNRRHARQALQINMNSGDVKDDHHVQLWAEHAALWLMIDELPCCPATSVHLWTEPACLLVDE
jgi:hypothetical protein